MATLQLTQQSNKHDLIKPKFDQCIELLELRKDVWLRISVDKRKKWIKDNKDPILSIAFEIHQYLENNFFSEKYIKKEGL